MSVYITLADLKANEHVDFTDDDIILQGFCDLAEELVLSDIEGSITGKGTVETVATTALVGTDSDFTDYTVGDTIKVEGETLRTIATITDDTHLTVDLAFSTTKTGLTYVMHPGIPSPVPLKLKQAMLLIAGHFYNTREATVMGVSINKIPYGYDYLISKDKNYSIA